jgi:hypothetical protein
VVPWERHSSSRRWVRHRSVPLPRPVRRRRRTGGRAWLRPPPPPLADTADGSLVSHQRAERARSAPAHRTVARRYIARLAGGPDPPHGARSGRTGAPGGQALFPRSAGLHRLSGRPSRGGPSAFGPPPLVRVGARAISAGRQRPAAICAAPAVDCRGRRSSSRPWAAKQPLRGTAGVRQQPPRRTALERKRAALRGRLVDEKPAATYSPRPLRAKYHRRCGA